MKSLAQSDLRVTKETMVSKDLSGQWAQRVEMEKMVRQAQLEHKVRLDLGVKLEQMETEVMLAKWVQWDLRDKQDLGESVANKVMMVSKVYKGHLVNRVLEVYKDQRETEAMAQRQSCLDGYCQLMLSWV